MFPENMGLGDPQFQHSVMILLISCHAEAVSTCGQQAYMRFSIRISLLSFRQLMTTVDVGATTGSKSELICVKVNS